MPTARPTLTCYASARKRLTSTVLEALAAGWPGAEVVVDHKFRQGPAAYYGVLPELVETWRLARAAGERIVYVDRGYLARETHFRVTIDRPQGDGLGRGDPARLVRLGIQIEPWRLGGRHVLLCVQSDWHHRLWCGLPATVWEQHARDLLARYTDRPVVTRWTVGEKNGPAARASLRKALDGAHCVVTWNSAAAIEAILMGVPAVVLGPSAAAPMATPLADIDLPRGPRGRVQWASVLAAQQWTLPELADGTCYRSLMEAA